MKNNNESASAEFDKDKFDYNYRKNNPFWYRQYRDELATFLKQEIDHKKRPKLFEDTTYDYWENTYGATKRLHQKENRTLHQFFPQELDKKEKLPLALEKQEALIKKWIEEDFGAVDKIPHFLLSEDFIDILRIFRVLENISNDKIKEKLLKNPEIETVISSLVFDTTDGTITRPEFAYSSESEIPNSNFITFEEDKKEDIQKIVEEIKSDEEKTYLLFSLLKDLHDTGKVTFGCGSFGGFKTPTGHDGCVIAKRNLETIFGKEIPYLTYTGDRCYFIDITKKQFNYPGTGGVSPDIKKIFAGFGKDLGEKILTNLQSALESSEKKKEELKIYNKRKKEIEGFGVSIEEVEKNVPEIMKFLMTRDDRIQALDLEKKLFVFLGDRSEWGSSGGVGYFSNVLVWHDGEVKSREFQYRDRYDAGKDRWEYNFKNVKIDTIKEFDSTRKINLLADETPVSFEFEKKEKVASPALPELSLSEQAEFKSEIEEFIRASLQAKELKHEGHTYFDRTFQGQYVPWAKPKLHKLSLSPEGYAVFVIKETIDYGRPQSDTPQERFELYTAKYSKNPKQILEDHAYVVPATHPEFESCIKADPKYFGDSTINILSLDGNKVEYSTREGVRTLIID